MKKGTKVDRLSRIVDAFSDAGIPVQLMGFTGFPGEDRAQAQTTLDIAAWLSRKAATVALGKFGLTPGSDVARNPTQYGIEVLYDQSGDAAVPWELTWRHRDLAQVPPEVDDLKSSLRLVRGFPYPFLGATTTLHSLLYFSARPPPSSPIPQWSYDFEPGVEFEVIPFYFTTSVPSPEAREEFLVQSSLTGRFLAIGAPMKQALEAYFRGGRWPAHRAGPDLDPSYRRLLDFLVDHSLALFLPRGAQ